MISTRNVLALIILAEEGHFSRAAGRLAVTQSAFSRRIQALETELGVKLVDRTSRDARLTPIGERFVVRARDALKRLDAVVAETKAEASGLRGLLRIGYNKFALTGPLISMIHRYRRQFPEVRIDLLFTPSSEQLMELENGVLDLGAVVGPAPPKFNSYTLQKERLIAVVPETHRYAGKDILMSDLSDEAFVLGRLDNWRLFRTIIEQTCLDAGFVPRIVQDAATEEAIFGLIAAGVGITLTVEGSIHTIPRGLRTADLVDCKRRIETALVWRQGVAGPQTERFLAIARGCCLD